MKDELYYAPVYLSLGWAVALGAIVTGAVNAYVGSFDKHPDAIITTGIIIVELVVAGILIGNGYACRVWAHSDALNRGYCPKCGHQLKP